MNWVEFQEAKTRLIGGSSPPLLMMSGMMHDNGTRYLLEQKGVSCDNTETDLFSGHFEDRDFVWNGSKVRVMGNFQSGGHPALAGLGAVYCAGRVMDSYFFFHSGHYHPKQENALYFLCNFIEQSCEGLSGITRDTKVAQLCAVNHRFYRDKSETETYWASFAQIAEGSSPQKSKVASSSLVIPRSTPIRIGAPSPSVPIPISGSSKQVVKSSVPSLHDMGVTAHGRHLRTIPTRPAQWIPDANRTRCAGCNNEFGLFRRKHHCRQCGDIFCADCSNKQKALVRPARRNTEDTDAGPYRVCNTCHGIQEP